ncbi:MAG: rod shape-determining protein RodA [Kiritimatiellaeota bacterium]|nr:rod shape-determining protein RodA [Kiritimatiellota bacterium]
MINKETRTRRPATTGSGFRNALRHLDYLQLAPMLCLLVIGLFYIYSTGHQVGGKPDIWKKQIFFISIGFAIWAVLASIDYRIWKQWALVVYLAGVVSLALVLCFGEYRWGARRWFSIFHMFSVQPSEFAKLAVVVISAWVLSLRGFKINDLRHVAGFLAITLVPFVLVLVEPDLGSSMILWPIAGALLFAAGLKWKWILIAVVALLILIPASYPFLNGYQKERVLVFLDPSRSPNNKGWNSRQSELAVGSGGLFGKGLFQSTQSTLGFIPKTVANSDFIFSVIAEENGFVGSLVVLGCYLLLIASTMRTAAIARDSFGRYLAVGTGTLLFVHSFVNIGMTVRLMPVTGLPLPLVSLGGSFIVSTMISLGILQSIHIRDSVE